MKLIAELRTMNDVILLQSKTPFAIEDGKYQVEIKTIPKKRTLRQNSYFWELVGEIARKEDGDLRNTDALYTRLLEMSGAKYEVIYLPHDSLISLLQSELIRHVKIVKQTIVRNIIFDTAYIFYGSSKMDTKQMAQLIDTTLNYAANIGIYTPYWEALLKEN